MRGDPRTSEEPNDLACFFVERTNAGGLEGIVAPFEEGMIMAGLGGRDIRGHDAIRVKYAGVEDADGLADVGLGTQRRGPSYTLVAV